MAYFLKLYGLTFLAFLVIDMIWLGIVARGFYREQIGFLLAPSPNWIAAFAFYLLFIAGVLVFVVLPGLEAESIRAALWRGALFGLITYATYDLTNLATVKDWPLLVTFVDLAWGSVLSASVAAIGYAAGRWLA